jgi:tRNA nucleotidyltransferase (CCA-adding enzyme)
MKWKYLQRSIEPIAKKISAVVTPSKGEEIRLRRVDYEVIKRLEDSFSKLEIAPEIFTGGSYAKGTWLRGEADIDYFLLFPPSYPSEKLEGQAIETTLLALKGLQVNMRYAQHPYVEAFVEETRINVVPCFKVEKGKWQSAADRSPFHTEYIRTHFDDALRLETRILKKFIKSSGLYGAEVRVQGLSGYVCEVLILKYHSFESVLRGLSELKQGEIISVEPFNKELASSFQSALVILDPVDTTRNLGTAISFENAGRLILKARAFLSRPARAYFGTPPKRTLTRSKSSTELLKRTMVISFRNKKRSDDILWGELRKSISSLVTRLELLGFKVLRNSPASNEAGESAFVFLLLDRKISTQLVRTGPDIFRKGDLESYLQKNRRKYDLSWIDGRGKIASIFTRDSKSTDAFSVARKLLTSRKDLAGIGLSKSIRNEIRDGFSIFDGMTIIKSKKLSWLKDCVTSLVSSEDEF